MAWGGWDDNRKMFEAHRHGFRWESNRQRFKEPYGSDESVRPHVNPLKGGHWDNTMNILIGKAVRASTRIASALLRASWRGRRVVLCVRRSPSHTPTPRTPCLCCRIGFRSLSQVGACSVAPVAALESLLWVAHRRAILRRPAVSLNHVLPPPPPPRHAEEYRKRLGPGTYEVRLAHNKLLNRGRISNRLGSAFKPRIGVPRTERKVRHGDPAELGPGTYDVETPDETKQRKHLHRPDPTTVAHEIQTGQPHPLTYTTSPTVSPYAKS